jgi:hypothetical protein
MTEHPEHDETAKETVAVPVSLLAELFSLFKNFPAILADIEKLLADVNK